MGRRRQWTAANLYELSLPENRPVLGVEFGGHDDQVRNSVVPIHHPLGQQRHGMEAEVFKHVAHARLIRGDIHHKPAKFEIRR